MNVHPVDDEATKRELEVSGVQLVGEDPREAAARATTAPPGQRGA
jgi:hypothetical protein